jgi:dTDP-4-amino-4,6-dideoxygalactose transaminase
VKPWEPGRPNRKTKIEADRRDDLKEYLKKNAIGTLIQWGGQAVHRLKALGFTQNLPQTDLLFQRMLMMPMNMALSDEDLEYVCDTIRTFYGYRG